MRLPLRLSRRRQLMTLAATGALVVTGLVALPGVAYAAPNCSVTYAKTWQGGTGFGANITITNTGDAITNGWQLLFNFANGQTVTNGWPVSFSQSGTQVTVASNATWNASLGTGASITVGFNGTSSGTVNTDPTAFTLNGTTCNGGGTTQPSILATPSTLTLTGGATGTASFRLSAAPTGNVAVTLARTGSTVITASASTLTLTTANWQTGVTVTFTAAAGTTAATSTFTATATGYTSTSVSVSRSASGGGGGGSRVDNPYAGAGVYNNPQWRANAMAEPGGSRIANQPTGVWLDRISAIEGNGSATTGSMGLADHLDEAVVQAGGQPFVIQIVIYNLPGRDCSALASNGELGPTELPRYKAEYIDPIAEIMARPAYANLRIVAVIEIDSLPNLVSNVSGRPGATAMCDTMNANGAYVEGVGYALAKLGAIPNVYNYIDAAHHGWVGWDDNFGPTADKMFQAANASGSTRDNVHGFITNTANYSALTEPFVGPVTEALRPSTWIDWNRYNDELTFAQAFRNRLITAGFNSTIGMLIDTSRNGWGGPNRPTAASTSTDINTFVNQSRIDRRIHKGNWCNQSGAGLGERPRAAPAANIDAYVWIKPPGESDGSSSLIPNDEGKGFDRMCDPTYTGNARNGNSMSGALPNAPLSGHWFSAQFQQLMTNAYPAL